MAKYLFREGELQQQTPSLYPSYALLTNIIYSPCLEPTDAKILPVLQSKPKGMTDNNWSMLCGYKFGTIIFGLPKKTGDVPIPVSISNRNENLSMIFPGLNLSLLHI